MRRNMLEKPLNEDVGSHAFGLRGEVGKNAVAQDGWGYSNDVLCAEMMATVQKSARFAGKNHILRRARAGTPLHPLLDEGGCIDFVWSACAD